jgi:hypothetical protein
MIRMSAFRRFGLLAAVLGLGVSSCELTHECTLIGCLDGLTVSFTFGAAATGRHETDVQIDEVTATMEVAPLATCHYAIGLEPDIQWSCVSSRGHSDFIRSIRFPGTDLRKVNVTVLSGATQISQQTFAPNYNSAEINGSGCGVCTTAQIHVDVP